MTKQDAPSLAEWLDRHARELLDDDPNEAPHIDDGRFARLVESRGALTRAEIRHLGRCGACRAVAGALLETVPAAVDVEAPARPPWWAPLFRPLPAVLAAAAVVGVVALVGLRDDGWGTRGDKPSNFEAPTITILAKSKDGWRVTADGHRVDLGGRIGFRYGNVSGRAKTITVLGWDGRRLHWYYPEKAGAAAHSIEGGASAVNRRLPDDILLDGEHRAGPLTVAVGFDVVPDELARQLEQSKLPKNVFVRKLVLEEAK